MKLLAIDGNSILNRAFYGIRPLSNTQGVFTHAIFGFMNIYLKNRDEVQPDAVAVAFDLRKPTFRHKAVATYKANRKGMPEELAMQLPYVKQLLTLLGIPVITCEGYEADDILGTLAAACTAQDADCVILTGDRDSLQLVSDHVTVRLTTNKETIPYTPERFQEEYGFAPLSLIDLKALMGDSSDNISGVAGVGQKTASKLIQAWGTVENLYAHLDEAGLTKSVYNKLTAGQDAAKESKWLATIVTDVPIDMDVQHYLPQPVQTEEVRRLLLELEMAKLLEKLKLSGTDAPAPETAEPAEQQQPLTEQPLTAALLDTWAADKMELPCCLFDGSRICVYHAGTPEAVYTSTDTALWEQLFQMPRLTFGAKPQYRFLLAQGIAPDSGSPAAKDAELAAYLLNSTTSAYEVERLCVTYHVPYPRSAGEYADLAALPKLYAAMKKLVEEQGMTRLLHFEQQLTVVLAAMEHDGIAIDRQGVEDFGVYLSEQIEEMQQMVYDEAGHTFNIGSPKQLGEVLFGEMQLPHGKKTKTGYSTNADILEKLRGEFKDAILAVASGLNAGYSVENAFAVSLKEMEEIHGSDSMIAKEIRLILRKVRMNLTFEDALGDFAARSGLDDVKNFADVFLAARKSGGELMRIITRTAEIIGEKIRIQEEILTATASKRMEQRIMSGIPVLIVIYIELTSPGFFGILYTTLIGRMLMTVCLAVYLASCWLADYFLEIEV